METVKQAPKKNLLSDEERKWFDDFIHAIRLEALYLESGVASSEKQQFYKTLFEGDAKKIAATTIKMAQTIMTKEILIDYLNELFTKRKTKVHSIAFNFSGFDLLVWAVVLDDDEESINNLLLSEAKINALWYKFNYRISSTIVEKSDNLQIPSQYRVLN